LRRLAALVALVAVMFGAYLALDRAHPFRGSTSSNTQTTHVPVVPTIHVTIPEGYTRRQIAGLAQADGLAGDYMVDSRTSTLLDPRHYGAPSSVRDLEGFLFPDTYFMTRGESVQRLVDEQLATFRQNFGQLDLSPARHAGLTPYDVLIIASIIEREAQVPSDRALVSAVIYNRLHDGMTLGVDATLRYYLNDFTHPLTESELALHTAYNTRIHRGLPPTPISNPGLASLDAAAHPAHVSYLYYVDKPYTCGKLAFATTSAEFDAEENAYNVAREKAGGRAPTRCP
jgi:peptidoglycan lytic transglycosylase G